MSHRYLRPEYIFLTVEGIKVTHLDQACFAWNTSLDKSVSRSKGLPDLLEHQWNHLPPECFTDNHKVTLVDVWSAGTVLLYCLTGSNPFQIPHTIEEATKVWTNFKRDNQNANLLPNSVILLLGKKVLRRKS